MKVLIESLVQNVLIPVALVTIPIIGILVQRIIKNFLEKFLEKAESERESTVITNIMQQVDSIVGSVVALNMEIANDYKNKNSDGKLTDEEALMLKNKAIEAVLRLLPIGTTENEVGLVGGIDKLTDIVTASIEKAVIELKK